MPRKTLHEFHLFYPPVPTKELECSHRHAQSVPNPSEQLNLSRTKIAISRLISRSRRRRRARGVLDSGASIAITELHGGEMGSFRRRCILMHPALTRCDGRRPQRMLHRPPPLSLSVIS